MFQLNDQIALVTGATGAIGTAIARALHAQGATVALSGTRQEVLEALAQDLGGRAHVFACNLRDQQAVEGLVTTVESQLGKVDILVNNAGITRDTLLLRMKDEDWEDVMNINLTTIFRLCRAVARPMMKRRYGRIINMGSVVGFTGNAGQTNYTAAKAGLVGFTKSLAQELASRGVTANCIAPGFIRSAMTEAISEQAHERILSGIPMGAMGTPEDIAAAAAYLASRESGYMTGQTLHVNGGMAML